MTVKLTPFIIPSTGVHIDVIPISVSILTMQVRRQIPEPKPPAVAVNIAGHETIERNAADPNYIKSYSMWEDLVNIEVTERALRKIAIAQEMTAERQTAVDQYRAALDGIEELPKSDKILWLFNIAIGSDKDITAILKKSQSIGEPTEEGIKAEINGFQR